VGYIVALVTLRKDLPVSDNRDIQYSCEGYMALALVVQETFFYLVSGYLKWHKNGLTRWV
jgi:argininosuccinate lyase